MKVFIGPYKNYIGPYQIADKIFFWVDRKTIFKDDDSYVHRWDYRACDKLGDWLADSWISNLCQWIHDKRGDQKVSVRIDRYDTWNMETTLSYIIHPMLVQLREKKHGAAYVDDEDVPENLRSTNASPKKEHEWDTDEFFFDRWDWVLDEMIWTFERAKDENNYATTLEINDRMNNGFRLFGKYYRNLWD